MNQKRRDVRDGGVRAPEQGPEQGAEQGAETAAEEVLDEVEDAETRLPGDERDDKDGEAADTLTPSPEAQESVQRDKRQESARRGEGRS